MRAPNIFLCMLLNVCCPLSYGLLITSGDPTDRQVPRERLYQGRDEGTHRGVMRKTEDRSWHASVI